MRIRHCSERSSPRRQAAASLDEVETVKPGTAHLARASSFSSFLRCCAYSLKHAFFSPSDFSAPYLQGAVQKDKRRYCECRASLALHHPFGLRVFRRGQCENSFHSRLGGVTKGTWLFLTRQTEPRVQKLSSMSCSHDHQKKLALTGLRPGLRGDSWHGRGAARPSAVTQEQRPHAEIPEGVAWGSPAST